MTPAQLVIWNRIKADTALLDRSLNDRPETVVIEDKQITTRQLRWGAKVSAQFKAGVFWIEDQIKLDPDALMDCMAFESAQTFDPSIRNFAGSSGTGLIQFMSFTAKNMGTTTAALAKMTAERQLGYVYKYFKAFGNDLSKWELPDIYMAILYPKAIGKPLDWAMPWKYGSIAYKQNSGLDLNRDRTITKGEACAKVMEMTALGNYHKG